MDPKKVLVIESDEVVVLLISHLLARQSYVVHCALNAADAVDQIARETYDAILVEPRIPGAGVELLRLIGARDPALLQRIIVLTGAPYEIPTLAELPLHGILRKPVEIDSLIQIVRDCVRSDA